MAADFDQLKLQISVAHCISGLLTHTINSSLKRGLFPDTLKEAIVTPIS